MTLSLLHHACRDVVEMVVFKHDIEQDNLDNFTLSVLLQDGRKMKATLDQPSSDFCGLTIELRLKEQTLVTRSQSEYTLVCVHGMWCMACPCNVSIYKCRQQPPQSSYCIMIILCTPYDMFQLLTLRAYNLS